MVGRAVLIKGVVAEIRAWAGFGSYGEGLSVRFYRSCSNNPLKCAPTLALPQRPRSLASAILGQPLKLDWVHVYRALAEF